MILRSPVEITSRLMAGVRVGIPGRYAFLSVGYGTFTPEGRMQYEVWIDLPDGTEIEVSDLRSGVGGGDLREGLSSLLSFLGAAAESYNYRQQTGEDGEHEDLFPPAVVQWAADHEDDLSMLRCEIEETDNCIEE